MTHDSLLKGNCRYLDNSRVREPSYIANPPSFELFKTFFHLQLAILPQTTRIPDVNGQLSLSLDAIRVISSGRSLECPTSHFWPTKRPHFRFSPTINERRNRELWWNLDVQGNPLAVLGDLLDSDGKAKRLSAVHFKHASLPRPLRALQNS